MEVDEHIIDVVFLLLDEDQDQRMSIEEFAPILYEWRHCRGYVQASSQGAGIVDIKL